MYVRQFLQQLMKVALILTSALMTWKALIVLTSCESPIMVVLSGSMEPAFHRGDLIFVTNFQEDPILAGDIVVFKVVNHDIPILHRVVILHRHRNGTVKLLTKGDNNFADDRPLYPPGVEWLSREDVVGQAKGYLPYLGMISIYMHDYLKVKYALTLILGIYVFLERN